MDAQERAKAIVAAFLGIDPASVNRDTAIGLSAGTGSLKRLRLIAALSECLGRRPAHATRIGTFGAFLDAVDAAATPAPTATHAPERLITRVGVAAGGRAQLAIGIDVEKVADFPLADDYPSHPFYVENFSPAEVAYCLGQSEVRQHFAGKFCAKEALVKADNAFAQVPFAEIEILNDPAGRPCFRDFLVTITHTDEIAAAVVVRAGFAAPPLPAAPPVAAAEPVARVALVLSLVATLLALAGLIWR